MWRRFPFVVFQRKKKSPLLCPNSHSPKWGIGLAIIGGGAGMSVIIYNLLKSFEPEKISFRIAACQDIGNAKKQLKIMVPTYPVILLTGVLGFNKIGKFDYFRNIPGALKEKGIDVFLPFTPPTGTIQERAIVVQKAVEIALQKTGKEKVHLIGHSMGGLDARYYISKLGGGEKVASLVTIATPHRGAVFADWAYENIGDSNSKSIEEFLARAGVKLAAFRQLTVKAVEHFNQDILDDPDVNYYSFGAKSLSAKEVPLVFQLPYSITTSLDGPNDGICSVSTSRWGKYVKTLHASHLEQIGWDVGPFAAPFFWRTKRFDTRGFFLSDILPLLVKSEIRHRSTKGITRNKKQTPRAQKGSITVVNPPQWTGIE